MTKKKKICNIKGSKISSKERFKRGKKIDVPCKSMSHLANQPVRPIPDSSIGSRSAVKGSGSSLANIKNTTKYDDGLKHSSELHKSKCKEYMDEVYYSYRNRKFKTTRRADFDALLGRDSLYADHMPASDLKLRNTMGKLLIKEAKSMYSHSKSNSRLHWFWLTFVDDRHMINERDGTAEVLKLTEAVRAAIINYTSFSAIGVIENQAIVNYPKDQAGKTLSVHAHLLCWGTSDDCANLKKRAKGFKSSITKIPIHSLKIYLIEGSFTRLARYMVKPPYEGKEVNYDELGMGLRCLYPARRVEKYHKLRLFEYMAKLPMENTLFGVREGVQVRTRVVAGMKDWQKTRKGLQIELGGRVYPLFEDFLHDNKRLEKYKPLKVKFRGD